MGFLEKILRGEKNENGITNKIDRETQAINKRLFDAEKEKNERISCLNGNSSGKEGFSDRMYG